MAPEGARGLTLDSVLQSENVREQIAQLPDR